MTMTFFWSGVALWFGLNAAFAAWRIYLARPDKTVAAPAYDEQIWHHPRLSVVINQIRLQNRN